MADNSNSGLDWTQIITALIGGGGAALSGALAPRRHPFTGDVAPQNLLQTTVSGLNDAQSGLENWINQGVNFPDATLDRGASPTYAGGPLPFSIGLGKPTMPEPNTTHFDMAHFNPTGMPAGGPGGVDRSDSALKTILSLLGAGAAGAGIGSLLGKGGSGGSSSGGSGGGGGNGAPPPGFVGPIQTPPWQGPIQDPGSNPNPLDPGQLPGFTPPPDPSIFDPNAGVGGTGSDGDPGLGGGGGGGDPISVGDGGGDGKDSSLEEAQMVLKMLGGQ